MNLSNRRTFLTQTGAGLAAGSFLNLNPRAMGANERVNLALIGGRNQGRLVALRAIQAGGQFKTFCDLDPEILEKAGGEIGKVQGRKPDLEKDYRRVLEDKGIDAVIIATPDHWHARMAIMACQAGKDVYCEKPLSQTIEEGHLIRKAARKHNRVFQVGTQRRSGEHFETAVEYIASGGLGKLCEIKAWIYQIRKSIGRPADGTAPAGVDYDAWLGPAPKRPFNEMRFHYNWRFFYDYGNTELGNQGVHMLDVAVWAIQRLRGVENSLPARVSATGGIYWLDDMKEVPDTEIVNYQYGNLLLSFELRSFAQDHLKAGGRGMDAYTAYYGTEGTLLLSSGGWVARRPDGSVAREEKGAPLLHEKNFLECVKSRKKPHSDVEIGRLSTTLCHLGNISYKLGRDVVFDPKTETFPNDAKANALLRKEYREPYGLPKV